MSLKAIDLLSVVRLFMDRTVATGSGTFTLQPLRWHCDDDAWNLHHGRGSSAYAELHVLLKRMAAVCEDVNTLIVRRKVAMETSPL